jgi:primary-amine oxidase
MASAQEKATACCLPARDAAGARRAIAVAGKVSMAGGDRVVSAAGGGAVMEDIGAAVQPTTAKASSKGMHIRGSRIMGILSISVSWRG